MNLMAAALKPYCQCLCGEPPCAMCAAADCIEFLTRDRNLYRDAWTRAERAISTHGDLCTCDRCNQRPVKLTLGTVVIGIARSALDGRLIACWPAPDKDEEERWRASGQTVQYATAALSKD